MARRLLLVDDEPYILISFKRVLHGSGYEIETAGNAEEALEMMLNNEFGVIVSDFRMPVMNGIELLRKVKELYPDTIRIMLSGYADLDSIIHAINDSSIYRFFFKPYDNGVIVEHLNDAFNKYELIKNNQKLQSELEKANTELSELNAELEHTVNEKTCLASRMAHYEPLTGLPNRYLFIDRFNQAIFSAQRNNCKIALLLINLDNFKKINDSFGYKTGDLLLKMVADRIRSSVRRTDTLAKLSGDEFALIISELASGQAAIPVIKKLMQAFSELFTVEDYVIFISACIGVSVYPDDGNDVAELMKNSDAAMYYAKGGGRNNFQFYANSMNESAFEQLAFENDLRQALERNEFILHYQPQYEMCGNKLTGFEALIRWQRGEHELVPPDIFIPILEETGMIVEVGEWVIKTACEQLKSWQNQGITSVKIAVNTSAVQFARPDFVNRTEMIVRESGIDASNGCLELEMTESIIMNDVDRIVKAMSELSGLGIEMSIDDFGTGYSSFSYLRNLPIHTIKIDRSFINDMEDCEEGRTIVNAIIVMAHALKLKVIAEGVETQAQKQYLQSMECDVIQGYLVGKPTGEVQANKIVENLVCVTREKIDYFPDQRSQV